MIKGRISEMEKERKRNGVGRERGEQNENDTIS